MRHVTEVESNLKSGVKATLGPKTLIVGPNASGKSALINAVELATSGAASDVAGRVTVASDALLRTLVPAGQSGRAHAALDDGTTAEWIIGEGRAARTGAAAHFPLRDIYENLLGTPATAQKWLLRLSGINDLPTVVESLARQTREARAKAKTLRDSATAQSAGLPPEPTAEQIEAAKLRGTPAELTAAEETLRAAEARLAEADAFLAEITAKRDAAPTGDAATAKLGESMLSILDAQITAGKVEKCGLCGSGATKESLSARRAAISQRIAEAQRVTAHRAALDVEVNNARHAQGVAKVDAAAALTSVNALKSIAKNGAIPVEIVRLQERWSAVRKLTAQAEAAEVEAATFVARTNTEKEKLDRESAKALDSFVAKVQSYLPRGDFFGLELDPVRFGLKSTVEVEGKPVTSLRCALSGAEWARVTAALSAAAAEMSPFETSIVVPEERAFDPDTLTHVLRAFTPVPCQVLLASPIMPREVPEGWTVVRVGGAGFLGFYDEEMAAEGKVAKVEARGEHSDDCASGLGGVCDCPVWAGQLSEKEPKSSAVESKELPAAEPPKKKRGRPSKAEKAEREAAAKAAAAAVTCPEGCGSVVIGKCEHGFGPGATQLSISVPPPGPIAVDPTEYD